MKAVILAGGLGTRLSEETSRIPKPMVEIGGRPILWHIMKIYSQHGINEFVICLGYKGYVIKEYFQNYLLHVADVTFDLADGTCLVHERRAEPFRLTLVETGDETQTGGRLKRVARYVEGERFCFTYGDGVTDLNITDLLAFHDDHGRLATVTAITPPGRFGALHLSEGGPVEHMGEKLDTKDTFVNGGFFVLEPAVLDWIGDDQTVWETGPMPNLAAAGELHAYKHAGFWHAMDTLRDRNHLEQLWSTGAAPWKTW